MADHLRDVPSFDRIVTLAERESGAWGLADDALLGRVRAGLDWIVERGPYTPDQVRAMEHQLRRTLVTRLRLLADRKAHPGIAAERIERPVFIVGFPRAGTTLLHSLLAEDPETLALQSWHMHAPSPPPGAGPVMPERIAYAQRQVEAWMDFCPGQKPMHPYIDKGAHQLCEDEEVFALDFRSTYPYHWYRVPTLSHYVALDPDMHAAFRFHRDLLQHLQWNTGKTRWVCKGPSGQGNLDAIFAAYPDALCVWPHRPIGEMYASHVALSSTITEAITGQPVDWQGRGRMLAEGLKAGLDRIMANALIDDPRVLHIDFRDVAHDPVGTVRRIADRAGRAMTADFEARVGGWLADPANAIDRYGRFPYSYEALGLDRAWVEDLFSGYSRRFGLA